MKSWESNLNSTLMFMCNTTLGYVFVWSCLVWLLFFPEVFR